MEKSTCIIFGENCTGDTELVECEECSHNVCKVCIASYIKSKIMISEEDDGVLPIAISEVSCPHCRTVYARGYLKKCMGSTEYQKLERASKNEMYRIKQEEDDYRSNAIQDQMDLIHSLGYLQFGHPLVPIVVNFDDTLNIRRNFENRVSNYNNSLFSIRTAINEIIKIEDTTDSEEYNFTIVVVDELLEDYCYVKFETISEILENEYDCDISDNQIQEFLKIHKGYKYDDTRVYSSDNTQKKIKSTARFYGTTKEHVIKKTTEFSIQRSRTADRSRPRPGAPPLDPGNRVNV